MSFEEQLRFGKIGESRIAHVLKGRGLHILPVYEKEISEGKGPVLFTADNRNLVLPDMLAFNDSKTIWIEAKHKTAFTWHRITGKWVTGIDLHHYRDYLEVLKLSPWPVWLLFLHDGGQAKDSPADSPAGLFGGELGLLSRNEHHRHMNHGKHGMVYWGVPPLRNLEKEMRAGSSHGPLVQSPKVDKSRTL